MSRMNALMWDRWLEEERARAATRPPSPVRRRSVELDDDLIEVLDRVAKVSGVKRSTMLTYALRSYFASWRPYPKEQ